MWALICDTLFGSPGRRSVTAGVAVLVVYALANRPARAVIGRVVTVAVPLGLLGYGGFQALQPAVKDLGENSWRVVQALVAGGVVASGWIVTFAVQELRSELLRRKTEVDMMIALRAEILDFLRDAVKDDLGEDAARTRAQILGGTREGPFHPFMPTAKEPVVFQALASDIHLLPDPPLDAIVQFYTQMGDVLRFSQDLQRPDYREMPPERRAKVYRHYVDMRRDAEALARGAAEKIAKEIPFRRHEALPEAPNS